METIKKGSNSLDVLSLQCSLGGLTLDGSFGDKTEAAVKSYQESHGLLVDGIVGPSTWSSLIGSLSRGTIKEEVWKNEASKLGVDPRILKAIHKVETSGTSYLSSGYPSLLFEAHQFWKYLKAEGKRPEVYQQTHPNILSQTWNKALYKGGQGEVGRVGEAWSISPVSALLSASWGAFQICGFNWSLCGCQSVQEFYKHMWTSEEGQLKLLSGFLKGSGIVPAMKKLDFKEIARRYNGEGYAKNQYDKKLEMAFHSVL